LSLQREAVRHVRKLKDTGLATYNGRDPASIAVVVIVVALVAILAASVTFIICAETGNAEDGQLCQWAYLLMFLGAQMLVFFFTLLFSYSDDPSFDPLTGEDNSDDVGRGLGFSLLDIGVFEQLEQQ
jgi:hypothetical protein